MQPGLLRDPQAHQARGAWNVEPRRRSPFDKIERSGPTRDRRPDPTVLRAMREVDPALDLEWWPLGEWWTGWGHKERPSGTDYGAWRLVLKGRSGSRKGIRLFPPWFATSASSGELGAYLRAHWAPKLRSYRDYCQTTEALNGDLLAKRQRAERLSKLDKIDHGEVKAAMRRAHAERFGAGESGQEFWQVHAETPAADAEAA